MFQNVLAVIPAHNESEKISTVVSRVRSFTQQVLVVNDASIDNTRYLAEKAGALVLNIPDQMGYGKALITGFEFAVREGFSNIVTLDADGAHDPDEMLNLLETHINLECHLTIGNRFEAGRNEQLPSTKRWANYFASCLLNRILGTSLTDVACGFRVLRSDFLQALLERKPSSGFGIAYEFIIVARGKGFKVCSTPVSVHYDASRILCTGQQELLDLIAVLRVTQFTSSDMYVALNDFQEMVAGFQPVTVTIGGVTLYLFPLPLEGGYLFQAQDPTFANRTVGRAFNFDVIPGHSLRQTEEG